MMQRFYLLSLGFLLSACVEAQTKTAAPSAATVESLKNKLTQRDEHLEQFKKASPEEQEACELRAGDCRLLVSEKRDKFLQNQSTVTCRQPDPDLEARCVTNELLTHGDLSLATDYYEAELWCLDKLLECLSARKEKAKDDAVVARAASRRTEVEQSDTGTAALARVSLADAKIKYVRATLPPDAEEACAEVKTKESCLETARKGETAYVEEFDKPEQTYQRARAAKRLDELTKAQAECYQPELDCLLSRLPRYGETAETRKLLEQNFKLLEQRQRLIVKLGEGAGQICIEQGTTANQPEIVRSYVAYVREPVLFFRMQLHRAFRTLHQAQIDCLKQ
jgi:hypothetical protein